LNAEQPLLLHPYFDRPEDEIDFDTNGIPFGLTDRGKETIEACDLARIALVEDRVHERECYFSIAIDLIKEHTTQEAKNDSRKYSAWQRACVKRMIDVLAEGFGYQHPSENNAN
jgi:hypothetical protein